MIREARGTAFFFSQADGAKFEKRTEPLLLGILGDMGQDQGGNPKGPERVEEPNGGLGPFEFGAIGGRQAVDHEKLYPQSRQTSR